MKKTFLALVALLPFASAITYADNQTVEIVNNMDDGVVKISTALPFPYGNKITATLTSEGTGPVNLYDVDDSVTIGKGKSTIRVVSDVKDPINSVKLEYSGACHWFENTFFLHGVKDNVITIGGKDANNVTFNGNVLGGVDRGERKIGPGCSQT